jgi:Zn-finger nucleic acid-binding protein
MTSLFCPACPSEQRLRTVDPHLLRVPFQRCDLCLGLLASASSVAVANAYYHSDHYIMAVGHGRHRCRNCGALFDQMRERCRTCLKPQTIGCVRCLMQMEVLEVAGVALDVCRTCRVVWFDRGELGLLVRRHASALQRGLAQRPRSGVTAHLSHGLLYHPEALQVGFELARASAEVATRVISEGGASAVVDVAASAGESAIELGAGAIDLIAGVLGDLF